MVHQVKSSDGVLFWVESADGTIAFDRVFAATKTSSELAAHGDFSQIKSMDDLIPPEEYYFSAKSPAQRRAEFTVIKGGKAP